MYQIDDPSKFEITRITLSDVVVTPRSRGVKLALKQRCIDFGLWMLHGEYFAMGDTLRKNSRRRRALFVNKIFHKPRLSNTCEQFADLRTGRTLLYLFYDREG